MVDLDELKNEFLNTEFASRDLQLEPEKLVIAAEASGETRAEFIIPHQTIFRPLPRISAVFHQAVTCLSTFRPSAAFPWTAVRR